MRARNKFTVTGPKEVYKLSLFVGFILILIPTLFTILSGPQHPLCYICFGMLLIPCLIFGIWLKVFKITVKGSKITVRKGIGITYSFDCSEIVKVRRKINITYMGRNEKMTIKTKSKKVSVETLMVRSEKMIEYILENVDSSKIITSEKIRVPH